MEKGEFIVEEEQLSVQAGVPRREQCLVCAKPIFLAERLKVGEKFYHRRCLKCARCQTQLTLGSFYETEVDGQFCCETCPDEEVRVGSEDDEEEDNTVVVEEIKERERRLAEEEKRISSLISNRLAMFERKPDHGTGDGSVKPNWRNSSLSDEQKSRSMKNFLQNSTEANDDDTMSEAPPLPSKGPPELRKEPVEVLVKSPVIEKEVILRAKTTVEEERKEVKDIRESQSVSNIRDMFEKKGTRRSEMTEDQKPVNSIGSSSSIRKKSLEEKRDPLSENKTPIHAIADSPMPDIFQNETTPKPVPSVRRTIKPLNIDKEEEIAVESMQIPSNDEISTTLQIDSSVQEIHSPRPIHSQIIDPIEEPLQDEIKPPTTGEIEEGEKVVAVPQKETQIEQIIELSATKESDQIKEPSLELRSTDREEKEEALEQQVIAAVAPAEEDQIPIKNDQLATNEEEKEGSVTSGDKLINCNEIVSDKVPLVEQKEEETSDNNNKYPLDLNPFGSEDEGQEPSTGVMNSSVTSAKGYNPNLNPFGDEEGDEAGVEEKIQVVYRKPEKKRISTNPFGSDEDDEEEQSKKVTPLPTPRRTVQSQRPEPSPRFQLRVPTTDYYGSASSLSRSSDFNFRGSTNSLSSTCSSGNTSGTYQRTLKKRRAPLPPSMMMREATSAEHLTAGGMPARKISNASMASDRSGEQKSTSTSPRVARKKRPAPKPPGPIDEVKPTLDESLKSPLSFESENREIVHSTPMKDNQSSDKTKYFTADGDKMSEIVENPENSISEKSSRRMIPLDDQLLEDHDVTSIPFEPEESVYYRRVIVPLADDDPGELENVKRSEEIRSSRQWEKVKQNKESDNRNRQSLISNSSDGTGEFDRFYNKSQHGKWKRRKGPAPSLPVPPKRVLQMLPLQDIKHELEVIEVQQQGLEKQGVQLEKMIREKTEGPDSANNSQTEDSLSSALSTANRNTKEVEDLIMQLFDLVVEKNELFRRQAELMYLRRQHRLEQEQADLEYEIRVLMAQPECNKTDSDKAKEEAMIARMVEVVKQRNEVVDSLEMDRLREAQEDLGIKQEIEKHTAKWDEEFSLKNQKPVKLSKKEKKTLKDEKKKLKNKKLDVDKDYDETETQAGDKSQSSSGGTLEKLKKKKKKFLIL